MLERRYISITAINKAGYKYHAKLRFIPNVACGINLNFAWYLYPALFIAVMLIYLLTSTLLVRKLNRITPAEVLKNRE